jgi:hypothetical protein
MVLARLMSGWFFEKVFERVVEGRVVGGFVMTLLRFHLLLQRV